MAISRLSDIESGRREPTGASRRSPAKMRSSSNRAKPSDDAAGMSGTEIGAGSGTGTGAAARGAGAPRAGAAPFSRAGRPFPLRAEAPLGLNTLRGVNDGPTFAPCGGVPKDEKYALQSGATEDGSFKNDSYSS